MRGNGLRDAPQLVLGLQAAQKVTKIAVLHDFEVLKVKSIYLTGYFRSIESALPWIPRVNPCADLWEGWRASLPMDAGLPNRLNSASGLECRPIITSANAAQRPRKGHRAAGAVEKKGVA